MKLYEEIIKWIVKENGSLTLLGKVVKILLIVILINIVVFVVNKLMERNIQSREKLRDSSYGRIITITRLVKKAIKIGLYFIGFILILDTVNINPTSLIATAGVGSLAIGISAQALIKDFINGFLIILENQYAIGDLVKVADCEGVVEEMDVRVTKVRAFDGQLFIIPNREISIVTNKQRGVMRAKVVVYVDSTEEPKQVLELVEKAIAPVRERSEIVRGPQVWGVTENLQNGYGITVVAYANIGDHLKLEYDIRQRIVEEFINNNVKLPQINNRISEVSKR